MHLKGRVICLAFLLTKKNKKVNPVGCFTIQRGKGEKNVYQKSYPLHDSHLNDFAFTAMGR